MTPTPTFGVFSISLAYVANTLCITVCAADLCAIVYPQVVYSLVATVQQECKRRS